MSKFDAVFEVEDVHKLFSKVYPGPSIPPTVKQHKFFFAIWVFSMPRSMLLSVYAYNKLIEYFLNNDFVIVFEYVCKNWKIVIIL